MPGLHLARLGVALSLRLRSSVALLLLAALLLSGCVAVQPAATEDATDTTSSESLTETPAAGEEAAADLSPVKGYLLEKATALKDASAELKAHADAYYG